jgi:rod shape-determining protein MreC
VYDRKVIRRRRAVFAVLVALSIGILTAYFGESGGGFFHSLQRGAQTVLEPLEDVATRALKPVRDFFGWAGDTFEAKGENEKLQAEVERLRADLAEARLDLRDREQLAGLAELREEDFFPKGTEPVSARVIARSSTAWYSTIQINRGSGDGLRVNQPVIAEGGLVGKVTVVTGGTATVTLITDASSAVSAQVYPNGATGFVRPEVGNPNDLLLDIVDRRVTEGTMVWTSGFVSGNEESLFPRGIPIGEVVRVEADELESFRRVHIDPYADLRRFDVVEVLTRRGSSQAVALPGAGG